MNPQYLVQGIFFTAGTVSLLAAILNWDWFFNTRNAEFFVRTLGRKGTRIFYGLFGLFCVIMSYIISNNQP